MSSKPRVPPGQRTTDRWPVLHVGPTPKFDESLWDFKVFGEVDNPLQLRYREFLALPSKSVTTDIHCVTSWSMLGMEWEGVGFRTILDLAKVRPAAKHVIAHSEQGYTANVPLEDCLRDDVLLAYAVNGRPLEPEHGFPLRLFVPHLYFWKSAKWLRGLEFSSVDKPGFWEQRGYHNYGDPWREQRYWGD
ncbi:MAG TPA: sulfite oxidase-like oxidoreductase [Thermoplasmata archaeon]|nr:sulfite oxidase-like oxidoreductase [Thermoplasmata archaeon]